MRIRRVVGHSMEPALRNGQIIIVQPTKNLIVGDVVIASWKDQEVVKQIKVIKNGSAYLSGNNQAHDLGWVKLGDITNKVVFPRVKLVQ